MVDSVTTTTMRSRHPPQPRGRRPPYTTTCSPCIPLIHSSFSFVVSLYLNFFRFSFFLLVDFVFFFLFFFFGGSQPGPGGSPGAQCAAACSATSPAPQTAAARLAAARSAWLPPPSPALPPPPRLKKCRPVNSWSANLGAPTELPSTPGRRT